MSTIEQEITEAIEDIVGKARLLHFHGVLSDDLLRIFERSMTEIRPDVAPLPSPVTPNQPELFQ